MKPVWIIWLAFLARGAYYAVQLPLWEGFDEWAHFAALQYFAIHSRMPARSDVVSDEVVRSLELTPLAWSNNGWVAGAANHDGYWRLPADERTRRAAELQSLTEAYRRPADLPAAVQRQYEAQQPPLYYALLAPVYRLTRESPLPRQVLLLRLVNVLLASVAIPVTWALARRIAPARPTAVPIAAFAAAMPAVALFVARVGNDPLAF